MQNRIKDIRSHVGLNQTEFGSRIGVAQTTIAGYENGSRAVPDIAIRSICREFNINEDWLRFGIGDMFAAQSREAELGALVRRLLSTRPDSFQRAVVNALLRLDPAGPEWALLEQIYEDVAAEWEKGQPSGDV